MRSSKRLLLSFLSVLCLLFSACGASSDAARPNSIQASSGSAVSAPAESAGTHAKDALHKAANGGDLKKVKAILDSGVDVDARDSFGGTALHAAMFQENLEIIQMLIDYGFDVNAQGSANGFTPLHDAVWADNLAAAEILIENGADPSIRNKDSQTPAEKAKAEGKTDLYEILSEAAEQ